MTLCSSSECCVCLQVMYTDSPLVASAPTGSGKTVIFELAIIRLLMQTEEQMAASKIVYGMNHFSLCILVV